MFKIPFMNRVSVSLQEMQSFKEQLKSVVRTNEMLTNSFNQQRKEWTGNPYKDYDAAIKEIQAKYNAEADWGCSITGNIIDLRAAFIISNGLMIQPARDITVEDAKAEIDWAYDFMEYNGLDKRHIQDLAKEAEIEGKIALRLSVDEDIDWKPEYEKMVKVRYIPYIDKKYEIGTPADDKLKYEKLVYVKKSGGQSETVDAPYFVYNKFGGRIYQPNKAQPKIQKCLAEIDDVSKALRDWREINRKFSFAVPDVECDDDADVKEIREEMNKLNLTIGKGFVHSKSKFNYKSPPMTGVDSILKEIETKIKIISGTTGIPIHFLGLLDLLKNRATGETVEAMIIPATEKERIIWKGTWREVLIKGMNLYNEATKKTQLDPYKVDVDIVVITKEQWANLKEVFIPAYLSGAISKEYFLSQFPGMDVQSELETQKEEEPGFGLTNSGE